ncbi:hypothetical protein CRYUN_Cryun09bG0119900 [Craigia yunnanensis]
MLCESSARGDKRYQQLEGAIRDGLIGPKELAQYFLTILNLSDQYKKWAKFSTNRGKVSFIERKEEPSISSKLEMRQKKQYLMDHTQVKNRELDLVLIVLSRDQIATSDWIGIY